MSIRDERKQQSRQAILDAALTLSTSGRSFSTISLREVAREAGLVPTAFYRHFQDMEELGSDLVDYVSIDLHHLLRSLRQGFQSQTDAPSKTRLSIEHFFHAVDLSANRWQFLIGERWGGSPAVRNGIAREIRFFIEDLAQDLSQFAEFKHLTLTDTQIMADVLINLSFSWAMTWLGLRQTQTESSAPEAEAAREAYIQLTTRQTQLLFRGISNWDSNTVALKSE